MRQKPYNQDWTEDRVARLGYLVGLGWDGAMIAEELALTPGNVYRQASRIGLSFRDAAMARQEAAQMSEMTTKAFDDAALSRGISRAELIRRLMLEISCDPVLIDNILDDREELVA